jgi:hypothetical protein
MNTIENNKNILNFIDFQKDIKQVVLKNVLKIILIK